MPDQWQEWSQDERASHVEAILHQSDVLDLDDELPIFKIAEELADKGFVGEFELTIRVRIKGVGHYVLDDEVMTLRPSGGGRAEDYSVSLRASSENLSSL